MESVIIQLLSNFGFPGMAFGILFYLYLKQGKRINELEDRQLEMQDQHTDQHIELINNYAELAKNTNLVIERLTACIQSIKSTLERIERKSELK